jgi:hypothetical protein
MREASILFCISMVLMNAWGSDRVRQQKCYALISRICVLEKVTIQSKNEILFKNISEQFVLCYKLFFFVFKALFLPFVGKSMFSSDFPNFEQKTVESWELDVIGYFNSQKRPPNYVYRKFLSFRSF